MAKATACVFCINHVMSCYGPGHILCGFLSARFLFASIFKPLIIWKYMKCLHALDPAVSLPFKFLHASAPSNYELQSKRATHPLEIYGLHRHRPNQLLSTACYQVGQGDCPSGSMHIAELLANSYL